MELVVFEGTNVFYSVLPCQFAKAVHFIVLPETIVLLVVCPDVDSLAFQHPIFELAVVA